MRLGAVSFLVGILLLQALPELPASGWTLALPVVLLALAFVPPLRLPAWGVAGFLWALLLAPPPMTLPAELEGVELWVEGWIATIPDREWRNTRFEFVVDRAMRGEQPAPLAGQRLRLAWWNDGEADDNAAVKRPPCGLATAGDSRRG